MKIGVLALQGAVEPHKKKLQELGVEAVEVRTPAELESIAGIILPGGESTAMIHLLKVNKLWEPLKAFLTQKPGWGLCAGAILLARQVTSPAQESLGVLDIGVARNAFGRQVDSFIDTLSPSAEWTRGPVEGVFIRAPRIIEVGKQAHVLFTWKDEPVMVQQGKHLAATFHPELTESPRLHEYFVELCK